MRQRNITGYPLIAQPDDGSGAFDIAADEVVDYPTLLTGCAEEAPAEPADKQQGEPADKTPPKKTTKAATAATADGGDPA